MNVYSLQLGMTNHSNNSIKVQFGGPVDSGVFSLSEMEYSQ